MNGEGRAEQLTNAGWALFRAGNLRGAARDFSAALAADPDHINALLGISQTHSAFGEFAEAEAAADRLLAINPNLPQAHRVKCDILRRMRMPHEARIHAEQSIKLDPMEPLGYHYLAVIFYGWKDYRKALKVIAEGRKIAPWYGVLAAQEALILLEKKGAKAAEIVADEALRLSPEDNYVVSISARIALMRNRLKKARHLLEVLLHRNANDEEAISLYLLTDRKKYKLLRAQEQSANWRKEHGLLGWAVWALVWTVILLLLGLLAVFGNVPVILASIAYRFFWRAQYGAHRKAVKAHFVQTALKPAY